MSLTRRDALKLGVFGAGALLLPFERLVSGAAPSRMAASALPQPYTVPLSIPTVLAPVRTDATTAYYRLSMREVLSDILPGYKTPIWGYDGTFPGPTMKVNRHQRVVVQHLNLLPSRHRTLGYEPTTSVHLHGSASLPQYDGYASDTMRPGQYKTYEYPNYQDSRMLWYHDHGAHHTGPNVYAGLAGLYLISDSAAEANLPIPKEPYDIPLVISDAMFTTTGELLWDDHDHSGVFGDVILVNGRPWPVMEVERRKYRFRILNASVNRGYTFQLSTGHAMTIVGTDAGLVPNPIAVKSFRHGSAERYEVVIDFEKYTVGTRVELRNLSNKNNINYTNTNKVMQFHVVSDAVSKENNEVPDSIYPENEVMKLEPTDGMVTRQMKLVRSGGKWTINGKTWEDVVKSRFRATLANPAPETTEIWEVWNDSGGWNHPVHIHLVDFRILGRMYDRSGVWKPPLPHELGPKDVVYVGENERVRLIMHFGPQKGRYMIHCHNLAHEDHDMMGQFEVGSGGPDPMSARAKPLPAPPL